MPVEAGSPHEARLSDEATASVTKGTSETRRRAILVSLCLIEVAWISALAYSAVQAVDFGLGLI